MYKSAFRIVSKFGLLLVLLGFFMPVTCNLNAFQIAEYASNQNGPNLLSMSLYALFYLALIGIILVIPLLINKGYPLRIDWINLAGIIISSFVSYLILTGSSRQNRSGLFNLMGGYNAASMLQYGAYVIFFGLIVTSVSLCIASLSGEAQDPANFANNVKSGVKDIVQTGLSHLSNVHMNLESMNAQSSRQYNDRASNVSAVDYGDFYSSKTLVPQTLLGTWYRHGSGQSTTLIISADKLQVIRSDGKVMSSLIDSINEERNPLDTKNEYPSGWKVVTIATSLMGQHAFSVGQKVQFCMYLNNDHNRLLWHGNLAHNAFEKV